MSDTKGHALGLRRYLEREAPVDQPISIHLTGCPNSCAQHRVGDIGLLGVRIPQGDTSIEGYHIYVGGGSDHERGLGREIAKSVPSAEVPGALANLLRTYMARRAAGESFLDFARRHAAAVLASMLEAVP